MSETSMISYGLHLVTGVLEAINIEVLITRGSLNKSLSTSSCCFNQNFALTIWREIFMKQPVSKCR